ncbi:hypothetical protein FHS94_003949, partial [Sphingomonas aerophila]|nr:hypothetical protein [Sphingomonas aerophila]
AVDLTYNLVRQAYRLDQVTPPPAPLAAAAE